MPENLCIVYGLRLNHVYIQKYKEMPEAEV
jgi:hypothetical protein